VNFDLKIVITCENNEIAHRQVNKAFNRLISLMWKDRYE